MIKHIGSSFESIARAIVIGSEVRADSHHMVIRKLFGQFAQGRTTADLREALRVAAEEIAREGEAARARQAAAAKPARKRAAQAPARTQDPLAHLGARAERVVRVAEVGKNGRAKRVVIRCQLPGCNHEREIATQDLFQVAHCSLAHKRQHQKLARG